MNTPCYAIYPTTWCTMRRVALGFWEGIRLAQTPVHVFEFEDHLRELYQTIVHSPMIHYLSA
jgi:hypothetical protein